MTKRPRTIHGPWKVFGEKILIRRCERCGPLEELTGEGGYRVYKPGRGRCAFKAAVLEST